MKKIYLLFSILLFGYLCKAQNDSIFVNNEIIIGKVKEITEEAVRFSYPEEELINSIYKNTVRKIIFANGRIQQFTESSNLKTVNNIDDYENVSITQVEGEIKGLIKLGDVSSKGKGVTALSNQERVKDRAYRKLKIEAAMMGANIVYLTHQRNEGNKPGSYWQAASSAETNLTGIAYTNSLPDYKGFISIIGDNKRFITHIQYKLWSGDFNFSSTPIKKQFTIDEIVNENGLIIIKGKLDGVRNNNIFRVTSYTQNQFNIFYKTKSTSYNISITVPNER